MLKKLIWTGVFFDSQHVSFRYRDYANGNQQKSMSLATDEFLRRFLLHVLPSRFVRIRYYGFMANRLRTSNLARARDLIGDKPVTLPQHEPNPDEHRCPRCGQGFMRDVDVIDPAPVTPRYEDSS
jgi:hypothetical protein